MLRAGGLVAIPTETVYGLAADASNPDAVRRIFAVKGRPANHPLIVHIAAADDLGDWAATIPPSAAVLADACWPGPLTLLVPRAAQGARRGHRRTSDRRRSSARSSADAGAVVEVRGGLAAPSANRFGRVSPTTAEHVRADLGDDVDFVLDGGPCPVGVESTIVDCTVDPPQVLRPGGISEEEIATLLDTTLGDAAGPSQGAGHAGVALRASMPECCWRDPSAEGQSVAAQHLGSEILDDDDLARYARTLFAGCATPTTAVWRR